MYIWVCFEVQDFNLQAYNVGKNGVNFLCLVSYWSQGRWEGNNELWTIITTAGLVFAMEDLSVIE